MVCEAFVERRFRGGSREIIALANDIIDEYRSMGFTLTLRQVYYQLVARDLFPDSRRWRWTGSRWERDPEGTKNAEPNYKWLGSILNDARLAGLIDWDAIEDRTRNLRNHPTWRDSADIIDAAAESFALDLWAGQAVRPEVWIEKDALLGVIEPACTRFQVPFFACRGYTSQSEQYAAGKRFADQERAGIRPLVLHLGDHDPSGLDMTRDNSERLSLFAGVRVRVKRLALNFDQIREYNPPPNPAKESDSRAEGYMARYGESSWELDALDPRVIDRLITQEIEAVLDMRKWEAAQQRQEQQRQVLQKAARRWKDVSAFLARKRK